MISEETIKEFQEAIREEFGEEKSLQEASKILNDLVVYYDTLAKINHNIQNGP
jgi:hypothetical protein